MNVFLIGYRATGKTSVGKLLAPRLGDDWTFVDIDRRIEAKAGADIATIFKTRGEPYFRDIECECMAEVAQGKHQVVALGGGTLGRGENRDVVHCGYCAWLTASPETIHARMTADPATAATRPNLTPVGGLEEIQLLLTERQPIYQLLADCTVDTEQFSIDEVVQQVEDAFWREQSELSDVTF